MGSFERPARRERGDEMHKLEQRMSEQPPSEVRSYIDPDLLTVLEPTYSKVKVPLLKVNTASLALNAAALDTLKQRGYTRVEVRLGNGLVAFRPVGPTKGWQINVTGNKMYWCLPTRAIRAIRSKFPLAAGHHIELVWQEDPPLLYGRIPPTTPQGAERT